MTTVRLLYKSYTFVAGIALILLGSGNYLAAISKVNHYQAAMAEIAPQLQMASAFLPYGEIPRFPNEARERWEIARAKLDFYHVVLSAGRLMMSLGLLCTAVSLIHVRRQRAHSTAMLLSSSEASTRHAKAKFL